MIIKSITLENFRQYKNINEIKFSTDPEKNVTIILGVNTSGKTTLIQAFNWCLYDNTTFKTKDLLNSEVAKNMPENGYANVKVRIELVHEEKEYTISRSQRYSKGYGSSRVRLEKSELSVSYKEKNGNTYPIAQYECANVINKILPVALSDYFFFDGERIQEINNKKDVVSAVRGLMGLDVAKAAVQHLDPNAAGTVTRKLVLDLNKNSNKESRDLVEQTERLLNEKKSNQERLVQINSEIDFAKDERNRLKEVLKNTEGVRELQEKRDKALRNIEVAETGIKNNQERAINDFCSDYFTFLIQPLLPKTKNVLDGAKEQREGIPAMDAKAIEYILKRGKCICGCDLTKNQGAVECIEYEKSLLPPHHIGTSIRELKETCNIYANQNKYSNLSSKIIQDYSEMRRYERLKDEFVADNKKISEEIAKVDMANISQIESDYQANERSLETNLSKIGSLSNKIETIDSIVADNNKKLSTLAVMDRHNAIVDREYQYAEAIYKWFKESYDKQEKEVKQDLLESVNKIFAKMYHGSRQVTIDNNYKIELLAQVGDEKISTDESKGLEAVKNFSFISGLVDLARKKARKQERSPFSEGPDIFSTEAYPIVMDAPFSNVDEIHINNISSILPDIAEQVILVVMNKDWQFAKETMDNKVGAGYFIEKVDNSDTYSKIVPLQ